MAANPSEIAAGIAEEEWRVRCDLAACYRAFVRYGWTDLIYTHVSARHPSEPDRYLINPYGLFFEEITASTLIVVDFDGNVVRGDYPYNEAGHAIHSAVLRGRPDVNWVLHTHTRAGMAVSCMRGGLRPLTQQAMLIGDRISYHPWNTQTAGPEECESLVADLGPDHMLMILENHGLLACGQTPGQAFSLLYLIENACKVQVDVMCANADVIVPDAETLERTAAHGADLFAGDRPREWGAILRSLERTDPSYRS